MVVFGGEQCCLVVVLFGVGSNFLIFGMLLFDRWCLIVVVGGGCFVQVCGRGGIHESDRIAV